MVNSLAMRHSKEEEEEERNIEFTLERFFGLNNNRELLYPK